MNTFLLIIFILSFAVMPIYYISILYLIYYKKIYKNKDNLKFTYTSETLSTYMPLIILGIISILFAIFIFATKLNLFYIVIPIVADSIVFLSIKFSCTKFNIYEDYLVVKNNYGLYDEIQSIILQPSKKENSYELKVTTKIDLLMCNVVTDDPKQFLKEIKTTLPRNIKIKEMPAK